MRPPTAHRQPPRTNGAGTGEIHFFLANNGRVLKIVKEREKVDVLVSCRLVLPRPVLEETGRHPVVRELILGGRHLVPASALNQSLNDAAVIRRDAGSLLFISSFSEPHGEFAKEFKFQEDGRALV